MTTDSPSLSPSSTGSRALVLGGGGSAGNAWLIGVLAGLIDGGVDATEADLVVGTSAGSTAAAQIGGEHPTRLLADILSVPGPQPGGRGAPSHSPGSGATTDHLRALREIIAASRDAADMRRRIGSAALQLDGADDDSRQTRWRATVGSRLPSESWPERALRITAVDARTGEPVVFDRESGVELVDAVAASCAGGFAYRIGVRRLIDGGHRRSSENADLAAGHGRVLVLSPLGGRSLAPREWGVDLATQVDELRAGGSRVEVIEPDERSLAAFGDNMMDPSTRPPSARAGFELGRAAAVRLVGFWG
jgi:NTE family protein